MFTSAPSFRNSSVAEVATTVKGWEFSSDFIELRGLMKKFKVKTTRFALSKRSFGAQLVKLRIKRENSAFRLQLYEECFGLRARLRSDA
jgi:hypothetical protein